MDRYRVARTWLYRGLTDLYFAFDNEDPAFEYNARFSEIMGLEKCLKAVLLFHRAEEYEGLAHTEAREALNAMARKLGHQFERMIRQVAEQGVGDVETIRGQDFDGYKGEDLIPAITGGYQETRYPVPRPVSDDFPVPDSEGWTRDPLSSSGITRFIFALCGACIRHLDGPAELSDIRRRFRETYGHRTSLERFLGVFPEARERPP